MTILVAGRDRSADIGAEIRRAAARLSEPRPVLCGTEDSALLLRKARSPHEYLAILCRLLRARHGIYTGANALPMRNGKPGLVRGFMMRIALRFLAYEHQWLAYQQGLINELVINALDMERASMESHRVKMEKKILELEEKVAALQHRRGPEGIGG